MPPNSTGRFLTAPVRAVRSSRRHSHLASCQEAVKRPPRPLRASGAPGPLEPSGPSVQSVQLGQLG